MCVLLQHYLICLMHKDASTDTLSYMFTVVQVVQEVYLSQSMHSTTHTHPFNGSFSGTTQVSRYHKGKTTLDFTEARDSEWQWHQLGHMQVCTLLQTGNDASTPPLSFLQTGCPSCHPTNSVKALKAMHSTTFHVEILVISQLYEYDSVLVWILCQCKSGVSG